MHKNRFFRVNRTQLGIADTIPVFFPGEARLSVPAAVDQNGNVSSSFFLSSSFFFLLLRLEAFWHTISVDYGHSTKLESSLDVLSSL